jgi:hypothetical protein
LMQHFPSESVRVERMRNEGEGEELGNRNGWCME